jgi:hypothetical protein
MRDLRSWACAAIFGNTINLLALTMVLTAWFLTFDPILLGIAGAAELVYLVVAFRSRRLAARFAWQAQLMEESKAANNDPVLDRLLLWVAAAGFATVIFFGFGTHLLNHRWPDLTHAEGWEAGAIAWTGIFAVYYIGKFGRFGKVWAVFFGLCIAGVIALFLWQALSTMSRPFTLEHFRWIGLIVFLLAFIDGGMAWKHPDSRERRLSRASFLSADVPSVTAFTILSLYLSAHPDAESRDIFVAGVIACQVLFSNAVFMMMEFEFFTSPGGTPRGNGGSPSGAPKQQARGQGEAA